MHVIIPNLFASEECLTCFEKLMALVINEPRSCQKNMKNSQVKHQDLGFHYFSYFSEMIKLHFSFGALQDDSTHFRLILESYMYYVCHENNLKSIYCSLFGINSGKSILFHLICQIDHIV